SAGAGGAGAGVEGERSTVGGDRGAPETAQSIGRDYVPRRVITPDGSVEVSVTPRIVELADLRYAQGDLQVRDRSRKESRAEMIERASKLDPKHFMQTRAADAGAPIVVPNGDA